MTKADIVSAINQWEQDYGYSFIDCFVQGNINQTSWGSWLLGFGMGKEDERIIAHAQNIISELVKGNEDIDEETLFTVYPETTKNDREWEPNEENMQLNLELIAEFLAATEYYERMVTNWFKNYKER